MILGIFGAGGLGREVHIIAKKIKAEKHCWEDIVFVDDDELITQVLGIKCYTFDAFINAFDDVEIAIAIGEPAIREAVFNKVKDKGIRIATLVHPGIYIDETTRIGEGSVICEGVTITSCVTIEENVYIHPHAVIGHDIHIGAHSMIGSNSEIGGDNKLGTRVYMGFMSGTKEGLTIGDGAIISAGGIVFRDVEPDMIMVGNPARAMKKNDGQGVFHRK